MIHPAFAEREICTVIGSCRADPRLLASTIVGGDMPPISSSELARAEDFVPIPGSERRASPSTQRLGPADPNEVFSVTICIRRRPDGARVPDHQNFLAVHPSRWPLRSETEFSLGMALRLKTLRMSGLLSMVAG
jgi:hypothetical protein